MLLDIALTLFLVLLNGFFVAAEFSIVKVRASQIELRIREGSKLAKIASNLIHNLDAYLSATQLGITLASLGLGWIGESVVARVIINLMHFLGLGIDPALAHNIALPAAFITITFLHIVFGELAPKSLAIQKPEQLSLFISVPLRIFYLVFRPFIWLLNSFANFVIKRLGFQAIREEVEMHSEEELRYLLEEGTKSGIIDLSEHKLLENVFEFSDTPVKQIMVPRNKIICVDITMNMDEIIERFIDEGVSRMPVYAEKIDNIKGIIYAKDIISMMRHPELILLRDLIRPAYFINEDEKINKLLQDMQRGRIHMSIVLDEFGGIAGVVTMEDIIEEIIGEVQDEYDEEYPVVEQIEENTFMVDASAPIDDANDYLPVPLPDSDDYETVGGLIIDKIGRIPQPDESIDIDNYFCRIVKRSERFIETVELVLKEQEEE